MMSKINEYRDAARYISNATSSSTKIALMKLLLFKLSTGYGPSFYLFYQLHRRPVQLTAWREYVDKKGMCQLQLQVNDKDAVSVLRDKLKFAQFCKNNSLPHPEVMFAIDYPEEIVGFRNYNGGESEEGFVQLEPGRYVIKTCSGAYGEGLWLIELRTDRSLLVFNDNQTTSIKDFVARAFSHNTPYFVQRCVSNAKHLDDIMHGPGTGTLRVVTFLNANQPTSAKYMFMKLTRGQSVSDNFSSGKNGNLLAMLNDNTHHIERAFAMGSGGELVEATVHPDTGTNLIGYKPDGLAEAVAVVVACAELLPDIPTVGWDVVISDSGPFIFEGNPTYDPTGCQLSLQGGIKSIFMDYIESRR